MEILKGDLLCQKGIIVHQCNCVTRRGKGLSAAVHKKWPPTNIYAKRRKPDDAGNIRVHVLSDDLTVVSLLGQIYPGKPGKEYDSASDRLSYFRTALGILHDTFPDGDVHFPYMIGCGLAGGNIAEYAALIDEFAKRRVGRVRVWRL